MITEGESAQRLGTELALLVSCFTVLPRSLPHDQTPLAPGAGGHHRQRRSRPGTAWAVADCPDHAQPPCPGSPQEFTHELRTAAAVKWYELELISQGRAAEIAGLTRAEFITALGKYQVSPFQYSAEEVLEDLAGVD